MAALFTLHYAGGWRCHGLLRISTAVMSGVSRWKGRIRSLCMHLPLHVLWPVIEGVRSALCQSRLGHALNQAQRTCSQSDWN